MASPLEKAERMCRNPVKTAMDALRKPADELEKITDKEIWPFPTYEDLLFEV